MNSQQTIATILALSLSGSLTAQQSSPLPNEMNALFGMYGPYATAFQWNKAISPDLAYANVEFINIVDGDGDESYSVTINWITKTFTNGVDGGFIHESQEISTAFKPTAVTRASPKTDTIYVAGWDESTGEAIIQKWRLKKTNLGTGTLGGGTSNDFIKPSIIKSPVLRCNSIQPITSITVNSHSSDMIIMEYALSSPKKVYSLNLNASQTLCSTPVVMYDDADPAHQAAFPGMTDYTNMVSGTHPSGGWIVYFEKRTAWGSSAYLTSPTSVLALFDQDLDGTIDSVSSTTLEALEVQYPFSEWIDE